MEIQKIKIENVERENLGFADKPFHFLKSILNGHNFPEKLYLANWGFRSKYPNNKSL